VDEKQITLQSKVEFNMTLSDIDHGLPLVALKEQRRDIIMSLRGQCGPISRETIADIASIQTAIAAIEAVIIDLDDEVTPMANIQGALHLNS
jgi:hypothetical protein